MGLFDFLKPKNTVQVNVNSTKPASVVAPAANRRDSYADSSSVAPDERSFYQRDEYYTYSSYPDSDMDRRVITFEERKKTSYPSSTGLYVAEIMLLQYCTYGNYPKPKNGYPGTWWFDYGIRDVGHALESLEKRGYLRWAPKVSALKNLKVDELKQILTDAGLSAKGKKAELLTRIEEEIPIESVEIPDYSPRYELTEQGMDELEHNAYVPYMQHHSHLTVEGNEYGKEFTVWSVNRLFPDGNTDDWRQVVGSIEEERFGVNMAIVTEEEREAARKKDYTSLGKDLKAYLKDMQDYINDGIQSAGDGYQEESIGRDYETIGEYPQALVQYSISIGKKFNAPFLYRETSKLYQKYALYREALKAINAGLRNIPKDSSHYAELENEKLKLQEILAKSKE